MLVRMYLKDKKLTTLISTLETGMTNPIRRKNQHKNLRKVSTPKEAGN
jgi:hypothetical protein